MKKNDLLKFCANSDDSRKYLWQPFSFGGKYIYATNGHILIKAVVDEFAIAAGGPLNQNSVEYLLGGDQSGCGDEVLVQAIELESCPECLGPGKVTGPPMVDCRECDGDGEFTRGTHVYDCKECDGEGKVPAGGEPVEAACEGCGGNGLSELQLVKVGALHFSAKYLNLIASLPGAKMRDCPPRSCGFFSFDGGVGVLMCVRVDEAP